MQIHEDHLLIVKAVPDGEVSFEIVMGSPAGWYLGTVSRTNDGFIMPYSRDTEYMSKEEAMAFWKNENEPEIIDNGWEQE